LILLAELATNKLAILGLQGWEKVIETLTQCCLIFHLRSGRFILRNSFDILPFHTLTAISVNDGVA
jgi:hypothetical protein